MLCCKLLFFFLLLLFLNRFNAYTLKWKQKKYISLDSSANEMIVHTAGFCVYREVGMKAVH